MKVAPPEQVSSDSGGWTVFIDRYGLPLVFLGLAIWFALGVLKWIKPRVERIVDDLISNNQKMAEILESHTREITALLATSKAQTMLLEQLAERTAQLTEHVLQLRIKE